MNWDIYIRDIYSRHICVYIDIRIYISKHVPYKYIYIYMSHAYLSRIFPETTLGWRLPRKWRCFVIGSLSSNGLVSLGTWTPETPYI